MPKLTINDIPNDVKDKIVAAYLEYTTDWVGNSDRLDGSYEVVDFSDHNKVEDGLWVSQGLAGTVLGDSRLVVRKVAWKPRRDEEYFYMDIFFRVGSMIWYDDDTDRNYHDAGNCFKTEELAQQAVERVKAVLKDVSN